MPDGDQLITLSSDELNELGSVIESEQRVLVPQKGGVFNEDGLCKIVIIRPCISRGKSIRGLQPIYEAEMLERNAGVFKNWPMYMDHRLSESAYEKVEEIYRRVGRSIKELGGRIVESWFDPEFSLAEDEANGHFKGAVIGLARPQPLIKSMLEADPEILKVSINAYPTGAHQGTCRGRKGMLIEGIRSQPKGSVDWVVSAGAGGQVLTESEDFVVSLYESYYHSVPETGEDAMPDLKDMTPEELTEHVKDKYPHLVPALAESNQGGGEPVLGELLQKADVVSKDQVQEMISEALAEANKEASEREQQIREEAEAKIREHDALRERERTAHKLIEGSDLPPAWKTEIKARYTMTPSGAPDSLLVEDEVGDDGKTLTADEVLEAQVVKDLEHAKKLIADAVAEGEGPTVRGQGTAGGSEGKKSERSSSWVTSLQEQGVIEDEKDAQKLLEGIGA